MDLLISARNKISNNIFLRNVFMIASGTAFAQFLTVVTSPLITRMYSPEDYGIYTSYLAISGIFASIGSLNYDKGIPIAENDEKAVNLMITSLIILSISISIVTTSLIFWGDSLIQLLGENIPLSLLNSWLPLGLFFIGVFQILSQWAYREKNFSALSRIPVSQSVFGNLTKIGFGLSRLESVGLIIGAIVKESSGITNLLLPFIKDNKKLIKKVNKKNILWSLKRYKDFPLYHTPALLLDRAGVQLPIIFITALFGGSVVGAFGLAWSIVNIPTSLIGKSISNVFYGEVASMRYDHPDKLKKLSDSLIKKLALIGLIPLLVLSIYGPNLFSFIYGDEWYQAGVYARILSFSAFFNLVFNSVSKVYEAYEKQREKLILNGVRLVLVFVVFGISALTNTNSDVTVGLYTFVICIMYLANYLGANRIMTTEIKKHKINRYISN